MARWIRRSRFCKIWYDPDQWYLGLSLSVGKEGASIHIGFGPFDITFERDY